MGNTASSIASTLVTKQEAAATYQPRGSYLTTDDASKTYLSNADAPSKTLWCADGSCKVPNGSKQVVFPSNLPTGRPSANGSDGTRVVMWGDGTKFFYGAGVENDALWLSTGSQNGSFKFYNQDAEVANISNTGLSTTTVTASGQVVSQTVAASGEVSAGSVRASGNIASQGTVTAANATITGTVAAESMRASGAVNARDVIATGSITAPNLYNRAEVDSAITTATQNLLATDKVATLANLDISPRSVRASAGVRVGNWMIREANGLLEFVRVNADGSLVDGGRGNAGYIALSPDGNIDVRRYAADGQRNWLADRYFWHNGNGALQANSGRINGELNVNSIRIGKWRIKQSPDGRALEIVEVYPDGKEASGTGSNVGYFALHDSGNINLRRHATINNYDSGWLADQFIRFDRPFSIQSSRGGYLQDAGGWAARPTKLTDWQTLLPRNTAGSDIQSVSIDKMPPFSSTDTITTASGGSYGGRI